ncbi:SDR family oxidoreductase [Candidatus Woesearchaeota archaeon]|jgi:NAD(P)-dependent dehydrogenase (short-subunit alcohol dehydrogenase family)|nr:SDR family oxidoreductase [Candidatus Woesearchaeota archaeon]
MNKNVEELFSLNDKVVVITGGAGMLGTQHAEILSDAGAHVVIVDIKQEFCDTVAQTITSRNNVEAIGIEADITNEIALKNAVEIINKKFGKIDILINNAAVKPKNLFNKFEEYSLEDWREVVSVDLDAVFLCSKIFGNEILKQKKGVIINIGSIYGIVGPDQSIYGDSPNKAPAVYSACKGGVINLTRYLATYFGDRGIRVNCLSPGGVNNNLDKDFIERYSKKTPLGRLAKKHELKGAILFLASDASSYMTGANLVVDGGWTAW